MNVYYLKLVDYILALIVRLCIRDRDGPLAFPQFANYKSILMAVNY